MLWRPCTQSCKLINPSPSGSEEGRVKGQRSTVKGQVSGSGSRVRVRVKGQGLGSGSKVSLGLTVVGRIGLPTLPLLGSLLGKLGISEVQQLGSAKLPCSSSEALSFLFKGSHPFFGWHFFV